MGVERGESDAVARRFEKKSITHRLKRASATHRKASPGPGATALRLPIETTSGDQGISHVE